MLRFFSFLFLGISFLSPLISFAACGYSENGDISEIDISNELQRCKPTYGIDPGDGKVTGGAKERVVKIANRLIQLTAGLAVLGIVIGGFRYVSSFGEEEKSKKAKESIKYAIIGFACALLSFPFVNAVIDFIYTITSQ